MLNRKGHIPTILLFVIGLILVIYAWFTFLTFNGNVDERANEINALVLNLESEEKYIFDVFEKIIERSIEKAGKNNFKNTFESNFIDITGKLNSISIVSGNFFGKIRNRDYVLIEQNGIYNLTVKDVFIEYDDGKNELKRTFDLEKRFNENGIIQRND